MGYANRILLVDLTGGELEEEPLDPEIASCFIGGRGYAAKLLYDMLKPGTEPFSPNNPLIFMTGPLTGLAPTGGRSTVSSKSPATGTIFYSNVGGFWGMELKKAGYDGVVVKGKARKPVYLLIKDGEAVLRDASRLWGRRVGETVRALREKEGRVRVLCIGPAGENLVKFAGILDDGYRAAGRGGMGAVMGSKRLKAIAVRGSMGIKPVNEHAFRRSYRELQELLKGHPVTGDALGRFGTLMLMNPINKHGILPVRNFREGVFQHADRISGETLAKYLVKKKPCALCPIACGRYMKIRGVETYGPEFETAWSLGPQCLISDPVVIAKANNLCNDLGLDTISMGNTLGFAMECSEKGLIKEKLGFGDGEALLKLIEDTAYRRGLGDLLAEGTRGMSLRIGGGSEAFAMNVKGLELPAYDPRGARGQALSYATSNRGGCHLQSYMIAQEVLSLPEYLDNLETRGKAGLVKAKEEVFAVLDSLIVCKFTTFAVFTSFEFEAGVYARLLTTATGFYFDEAELKKAGERIINLERCFNVREGFSSRDDRLPERLGEPLSRGPVKGETAKVEAMLQEYYRLRGWDPRGVPGEKKLRELGLQEALEAWPKLQVALDFRVLEDALRCAEGVVQGGADWLEAGTLLVKSTGMGCIRELRNRYPGKVIVADLKTMDTGFLEVEMAARAGADVVSIAGAAGDHTIVDAVGAGRKYGVKIMADLISVQDPVRRAVELEKLGVDYLEFHVSVDEQLRSGDAKIPFPQLKKVAEAVSIPVAVAGGLRVDTAPLAVKSGARIAVVGGAITRSANPKNATIAFLKAIGRA